MVEVNRAETLIDGTGPVLQASTGRGASSDVSHVVHRLLELPQFGHEPQLFPAVPSQVRF